MKLTQHRLKILVILPVVLLIALGFGIYQLFYAQSLHASEGVSKSIALAWSPLQQKIVNGTLWINVTWSWQNGNLSMTVKVNDDDLHYLDYLGLAFDGNQNGVIESSLTKDGGAIGFFPYNQCWGGVPAIGGGISFFSIGLSQSEYHTCRFTNETGYEFKISLPIKTLLRVDYPILMDLYYRDAACMEVGHPQEYLVFIEFEV